MARSVAYGGREGKRTGGQAGGRPKLATIARIVIVIGNYVTHEVGRSGDRLWSRL